ncbi:hypothetical protein KIL84_018362 [Mauremys mutica]|uniref:Uncharacterized protein n=1 Tax=Mauremys mutica TaxID=74926 RepID=A0A9D3XT29_9SAUR|nr:hypothetical protein KIL84_018362 [Mauremys mutica]
MDTLTDGYTTCFTHSCHFPWKGDSEDKVSRSNGDSFSSTLAKETMVFRSGRLGIRTPTLHSSETRYPSLRSSSLSRCRQFTTDSMAIEKETIMFGLPTKVIVRLLSSTQISILKAYSSICTGGSSVRKTTKPPAT